MGGAAVGCGGSDHPAAANLTAVQLDAIGYLGGAVLAVCLLPQIGKIVWSRSARDISLAWNCLYVVGLALTMAYLILKNATAAWIPLVIETAGCLAIMALKIFYEHTAAGRRASAAARSGGAGDGRFGRSLSRSASRVGAFLGGRYVLNAWRRRQQQQQQQQQDKFAGDDSVSNGAAAASGGAGDAADVVIVDAEPKAAPVVVAIGGGETELAAASRPQQQP